MSAAFDARLGPHAEAPGKPHLHKPMDPRFALGILAVLALGLFYMAYSIRSDILVRSVHIPVMGARDRRGSNAQGAPMSAAFDARLGPHAEAPVKPHLHKPMDPRFALGILAVLALGLFYMAYSIRSDIEVAGGGPTTILPFILLGLALLIALGFEFVNGFHDTANAVATCIYTHSLEPHIAVVYSGIMNFIGVLLSSGTVAYAIVQLLPVELILKVSKGSGFEIGRASCRERVC